MRIASGDVFIRESTLWRFTTLALKDRSTIPPQGPATHDTPHTEATREDPAMVIPLLFSVGLLVPVVTFIARAVHMLSVGSELPLAIPGDPVRLAVSLGFQGHHIKYTKCIQY